jgi:2-amino-4-hydroxy-6-hydroxymethyldihydropteridine diphosphokinase
MTTREAPDGPVRVAIAIGSNLGDRRGHIAWAAEHLASVLSDPQLSTIIETAPVDVPDDQPPYLNAAMIGWTSMPPLALMQALLQLERQRGRVRPAMRAARTLDLDVILYGDQIIDGPDVIVPHPRFRERAFVLEPLAEIAPDWIDPSTGETVAALLARLRSGHDSARN